MLHNMLLITCLHSLYLQEAPPSGRRSGPTLFIVLNQTLFIVWPHPIYSLQYGALFLVAPPYSQSLVFASGPTLRKKKVQEGEDGDMSPSNQASQEPYYYYRSDHSNATVTITITMITMLTTTELLLILLLLPLLVLLLLLLLLLLLSLLLLLCVLLLLLSL